MYMPEVFLRRQHIESGQVHYPLKQSSTGPSTHSNTGLPMGDQNHWLKVHTVQRSCIEKRQDFESSTEPKDRRKSVNRYPWHVQFQLPRKATGNSQLHQ